MNTIVVFGSTGAIGKAWVNACAQRYPHAHIHAVARSDHQFDNEKITSHTVDFNCEQQLEMLAKTITQTAKIDAVFVAIGTLHSDTYQPEKSMQQMSSDNFNSIFHVNTILPALIAKYFVPCLTKEHPAYFSVLSARVGSISDNRMGGWHAYRASKTALNMLIKNFAIETSRRNKQAVLLSLHPGTVNSNLSRPFQGNVPIEKLFSPEFSAKQLLDVVATRTPADSGKCFAWDGQEILP